MHQMHDRLVLYPIKSKQLTRIQKHRALQVLMLLKHKRCGKMKVHAVADRRKQRRGSKISDVTSPTAATELVPVNAEFDAIEG